jgi:hypothetical protein
LALFLDRPATKEVKRKRHTEKKMPETKGKALLEAKSEVKQEEETGTTPAVPQLFDHKRLYKYNVNRPLYLNEPNQNYIWIYKPAYLPDDKVPTQFKRYAKCKDNALEIVYWMDYYQNIKYTLEEESSSTEVYNENIILKCLTPLAQFLALGHYRNIKIQIASHLAQGRDLIDRLNLPDYSNLKQFYLTMFMLDPCVQHDKNVRSTESYRKGFMFIWNEGRTETEIRNFWDKLGNMTPQEHERQPLNLWQLAWDPDVVKTPKQIYKNYGYDIFDDLEFTIPSEEEGTLQGSIRPDDLTHLPNLWKDGKFQPQNLPCLLIIESQYEKNPGYGGRHMSYPNITGRSQKKTKEEKDPSTYSFCNMISQFLGFYSGLLRILPRGIIRQNKDTDRDAFLYAYSKYPIGNKLGKTAAKMCNVEW